jgi:uncharacterized protein Yka (UPF0111/DUF47 family)
MSAPVKHTCPDIDKAIKKATGAIKTAEYGMKHVDKSSDEYDRFREIINDVEDIEPILEQLRSSNDELRKWGEELSDELHSSANYIEELEQKLEKANKYIPSSEISEVIETIEDNS